jgi:hypothetical protein
MELRRALAARRHLGGLALDDFGLSGVTWTRLLATGGFRIL